VAADACVKAFWGAFPWVSRKPQRFTLYWLLVYLIGRHIHETDEPTLQVWTGVISGLIGGVVLSLSPTVIFPRLLNRRDT